MFEPIPSPEDLLRYDVNRRGQDEAVRQSLYDFQTYDGASGQTSLTFYAVPIGQSSKTKADTNMTIAGMLPSPQRFLAQSIEIYFFPGGEISRNFTAAGDLDAWSDDMETFYHSVGHLELTIGSKPYLTEAPFIRFPPKCFLKGSHAIAGTYTATAGNFFDMSHAGGRPYFLHPPLLIPSNQNFDIKLNWPTAVSMPSGLNARVGLVMDGLLYRYSQ